MSTPRRSLAVLIVEDYEDAAASTAELLRLLGHDVRTARNCRDALDADGLFSPDIILMEVGLPTRNGWDNARRLIDGLGRKPVLIALTGDHRLRPEAERRGFDHFFLKPVDPGELCNLINGYADRLAEA